MHTSSFAMWSLAIAIAGLAACGGDDGGSDPLSCDNYCTTIMANCTGPANQQYGSMADCMTSCQQYPLGEAFGDTGDNTLGCRAYHATGAMSLPDVHCRHAGPGGDGVCGANCAGFCTLVLGSCTGSNAQYNGDMTTCLNSCNSFATMPSYSASATSGNSFACRLYHATAASGNPGLHCAHTAATSATCN